MQGADTNGMVGVRAICRTIAQYTVRIILNQFSFSFSVPSPIHVRTLHLATLSLNDGMTAEKRWSSLTIQPREAVGAALCLRAFMLEHVSLRGASKLDIWIVDTSCCNLAIQNKVPKLFSIVFDSLTVHT